MKANESKVSMETKFVVRQVRHGASLMPAPPLEDLGELGFSTKMAAEVAIVDACKKHPDYFKGYLDGPVTQVLTIQEITTVVWK